MADPLKRANPSQKADPTLRRQTLPSEGRPHPPKAGPPSGGRSHPQKADPTLRRQTPPSEGRPHPQKADPTLRRQTPPSEGRPHPQKADVQQAGGMHHTGTYSLTVLSD